MDTETYAKWVEVVALQTEVQGMIAENQIRESRGQSLAYSEDDFNLMAQQIRNWS